MYLSLHFSRWGSHHLFAKFVARFLQADELSCTSLYLRRLKPEATQENRDCHWACESYWDRKIKQTPQKGQSFATIQLLDYVDYRMVMGSSNILQCSMIAWSYYELQAWEHIGICGSYQIRYSRLCDSTRIHRVSIWTASSQYQWQMKDNRDPIQKWKPSGRHCYCKGGHAKISIWSLPLADLCTFIFPTKSLATWDVSWCIIGSISYTMASNKYNFSPASTKRELGRLAALIKWKDGRLSHVFLQTIPLNSLLLALKKSKRKTKNAVGEGGRKKGKQVCEGLVQEPSAQETGFSGGMGAPERDMHI